jgi:hypothetical protein
MSAKIDKKRKGKKTGIVNNYYIKGPININVGTGHDSTFGNSLSRSIAAQLSELLEGKSIRQGRGHGKRQLRSAEEVPLSSEGKEVNDSASSVCTNEDASLSQYTPSLLGEEEIGEVIEGACIFQIPPYYACRPCYEKGVPCQVPQRQGGVSFCSSCDQVGARRKNCCFSPAAEDHIRSSRSAYTGTTRMAYALGSNQIVQSTYGSYASHADPYGYDISAPHLSNSGYPITDLPISVPSQVAGLVVDRICQSPILAGNQSDWRGRDANGLQNDSKSAMTPRNGTTYSLGSGSSGTYTDLEPGSLLSLQIIGCSGEIGAGPDPTTEQGDLW